MKLSLDEIQELAQRAYLNLNEEELDQIVADLNEAYLSFSKIKDLESLVSNYVFNQISEPLSWEQVLRLDQPINWSQEGIDLALSSAEKEEGNIKVRRVLN